MTTILRSSIQKKKKYCETVDNSYVFIYIILLLSHVDCRIVIYFIILNKVKCYKLIKVMNMIIMMMHPSIFMRIYNRKKKHNKKYMKVKFALFAHHQYIKHITSLLSIDAKLMFV